jgi:hypothetical protein
MDYVEKSFASASETSKLLITLSTAVIAFCTAVVNVKESDKTLLTPATARDKWFLGGALIVLLASTAIGLWTQLAITHVLSDGSQSKPVSAWSRRITVPFQIQITVFLLGILFLTIYVVNKLVG